MRVLICGDRYWTDYPLICKWISSLPISVIIEGEAKGADRLARIAATVLHISVEQYPADWKTQGKNAGPIRNYQMLELGKPDLVLAFHDHMEKSKGTKHMVSIAIQANIPTIIITH